MAKKSSAKPKANQPRIGQQTKTSAKGAHGGGVKFSQVTMGPGFKNVTGKGINAGKSAAKLPQAKTNISEGSAISNRPNVALGKGFGMNPFLVAEAKKKSGGKQWGQEALKKADKPPSKGGTKGSLRKLMGKKKGQKITRKELKSIMDNPNASATMKSKASAIYNLGGGKKGGKK